MTIGIVIIIKLFPGKVGPENVYNEYAIIVTLETIVIN
jgi:hypothetical protein